VRNSTASLVIVTLSRDLDARETSSRSAKFFSKGSNLLQSGIRLAAGILHWGRMDVARGQRLPVDRRARLAGLFEGGQALMARKGYGS
jgi:hypothetical protein